MKIGLLLLLVGVASANWYLLADDSKALPPSGIEAAMPVYQRFDAGAAAKPTLLVAVPIPVPASVQGCNSLVMDIPLLRVWNDSAAAPAPLSATLYQWRTNLPTGSWVYASRQSETPISIAANPPGNPNNTWDPLRARGVYRFTFTLATPVAGNTVYWAGLYFSQDKTIDGTASPHLYMISYRQCHLLARPVLRDEHVGGRWPSVCLY